MWMMWTLAMRNLGRHRRRTLLTALAIGLSVAVMSFAQALTVGMGDRIVRTATRAHLGDAQVHEADYARTRDETRTIPVQWGTLERARRLDGVRAASGRALGLGLLAIGDRAQSAQLIGVDPAHERLVTSWHERLAQGRASRGPGELVLGQALAKRLDVEVGARVVLTVADVHTAAPTTELMQVVGVLATGSVALDDSAAILELEQAQRLMGLPDQLHEIALRLDAPLRSPEALRAVLAPLRQDDRVAVRPWQELNTMVASGLQLMDRWMGFLVFIVFGVIALGIINTLSMSLAERTHELGVMRALGTTRQRMAALLLLEALGLGLLGALPGAALGLTLSWLTQQTGLSLVGSSVYGVSWVEPLRPVPDLLWTLRTALIFTALTVMTASVGALRAAWIQPAQAMRR